MNLKSVMRDKNLPEKYSCGYSGYINTWQKKFIYWYKQMNGLQTIPYFL